MPSDSLMLVAAFFDAQFVRWTVWVGLVLLTVALLLLVRTRWGQSQPLGKCIVLSLVAHLLLAIYISTVNIVTSSVGTPEATGIQVALVDSTQEDGQAVEPATDAPWESFSDPSLEETLSATAPDEANTAAAAPAELAEPDRMTPVERPTESVPMTPATLPSADEAAPPQIVGSGDAPAEETKAPEAQPIETPPIAETPEADEVPPPEPNPKPAEPATSEPKGADASAAPGASGAPSGDAQAETPPLAPIAPHPGGTGTAVAALPEVMKLRTGDHARNAKGHGASEESEAAVSAALKWLAANQNANGRWDAKRFGAGAGVAVDGENRSGAGATADTGITGLALLSFLAAGNTHLQGEYQVTVRRGLEYLLSMQAADGNLGASQNVYEKMYCHAMATCAISEAYAMSRDVRLYNAVKRAIGYTLDAQDRTTGGWRYRPGDAGDTSQLGWQVMALKSAQLAGIEIPSATRSGIERFLQSVSVGGSKGLACYQAVKPVPTRSMTAEAMVCRQFMGQTDQAAKRGEASKFLLEEVPGAGTANFYYWYYGTLALYQAQGEPWERWNTAMQNTLIGSQRKDGEMAGSWDPDPVWGRCGGRVYSTALGTLCLEVYYRFLPLYVQSANRDPAGPK